MNDLKIWESPEFGVLRVVEMNGEPWLVGKDVAQALGYSNPRKAIADHVDPEDKGVTKCDTPGGTQELIIINESGLYSLVLSSNLPKAKRYRRWVTTVVLPSIRKTGGYIAGQETMTDSELMAKALIVAQRQIENKTKQIEEMTPKALFADAVSASNTSILVGEMAKLLRQNGVDIGQNRFFEWLRQNGYLINRRGSDRNMPTQKAMEMGLFEIKETSITHADGHISVNKTVKVTGKGQIYFVNKLVKKAKG